MGVIPSPSDTAAEPRRPNSHAMMTADAINYRLLYKLPPSTVYFIILFTDRCHATELRGARS
jgi:hypothetical protein